MATVDKLYLKDSDAGEFLLWCIKHRFLAKELTLYDFFSYIYFSGEYTITNFPVSLDWYILSFCDISAIKEKVIDQYGEEEPINETDYVLRTLINYGYELSLELITGEDICNLYDKVQEKINTFLPKQAVYDFEFEDMFFDLFSTVDNTAILYRLNVLQKTLC